MEPGNFVRGLGELAEIPIKMLEVAQSYGGTLVETGKLFLTIAFLLEAVTAIYTWWIEGSATTFIARMIRLIVVSAIPLAALTSWSEASSMIPRFFQGSVVKTVTKTDNPMEVVTKTFDMVETFWRAIVRDIPDSSGPKTAYKMDEVAGPEQLNLTEEEKEELNKPSKLLGLIDLQFQLKSMVVKFMAFSIFLTFVGLPALFFVAVFLATIYGTQIVVYVGVAFGPILVCWMPWKPLAWATISWIRFMLVTSLTYAVAVLLAAITARGAVFGAEKMTSGFGLGPNAAERYVLDVATLMISVFPLSIVLGITFLFMAWLMSKADDIANALLMGSGGPASGGVVGGFMRSVQKVTKTGGANKGNEGKGKQDKGSEGKAKAAPPPSSAAASNAASQVRYSDSGPD